MGNLLNHYITLVMKCLIPNLPHCLEWATVIRVTLAGRPGRRSAFSMTLVWANNLHGLFQFSNLSLIIQLFRLTWKYLFSYNVSVKNFIKQCSLFVSFTEINTGSQRISEVFTNLISSAAIWKLFSSFHRRSLSEDFI